MNICEQRCRALAYDPAMVDHELEVSTGAALPDWLGGAGLKARYKRTWSTRREEFFDSVADAADVPRAGLVQRLEEEGAAELRDVFVKALSRAEEVGDQAYVSALAALVAAALDDAKIDEVAYLVSKVAVLQPLDLRVLWSATKFIMETTDVYAEHCSPEEATHCGQGETDVARAARAGRVGYGTAQSSLDTLTGLGFLYPVPEPMDEAALKESGRGTGGHLALWWELTPFGSLAVRTIFGLAPEQFDSP